MNSMESAQLFDVIQTLVQADTWAASQRIVEAHPELLNDEADQLLGQLMAVARQQGDAQAEGVFTKYHKLLARCRLVGVHAAFAEISMEGGEIPSELGTLLAALPPEQQQILLDALELSDSEEF